MFLRSKRRIKDGKEHRYFSVVENRRVSDRKVAQRQVLYLGEINDSQEAAWRKSLPVFDEVQQRYWMLSLFPDDRPVPAEAIGSIQVKLAEMELRRPRPSATAGWDAICGGNWGWRSFGSGGCGAACSEKRCPGRRSCSCWC